MTDQTLNIPGLIAVAVLSFFAIRWLFSSSSASSSSSNTSSNAAAAFTSGRMVDPNAVEQIAQMFPQLNRRDIQWDLQRNGGNVAATTERVLSGRGLETPPPSFRPQFTIPSSPAQSSTSSSTATSQQKEPYTNLITRYNLSSKISAALPDSTTASASLSTSTGTAPESGAQQQQQQQQNKKMAWSTDKNERARLLQRRREEMILAARRKVEEMDKGDGEGRGRG